MGISAHGFYRQFDAQNASYTEAQKGAIAGINAASFPERSIALEQLAVLFDEGFDMGAADFLLPFDYKGQSTWQLTVIGRADRVHGCQSGHEFALVIGGAARVQGAIPN